MPVRPARTLRTRLVLSIVGLLALASITIGVVSVVSLQRTLTDEVDRQLLAATQRSQGYGNRSGIGGPGSIDGVRPEFISVGTISAVIYGGVLSDVVYFDDDSNGSVLIQRQLTSSERDAILNLPLDGRPHTAELGILGDYRIVVKATGVDQAVIVGQSLGPTQAIVLQLVGIVALVTLIGIGIAAALGTLIVRLALRPLDRVAATASVVAELPLDRGEVALGVRVADSDADPHTEVGKVGAAINRMLVHVSSALTSRQESERKVRQFVADASHELRTPLASIRGYSELTRRTGHDLPPDVVHAMARIESEAQRMTSLVEDLLLLARLDEGRDLEHRPVDLSRMLVDALSDAHAAGPDHVWSLDAPEDPVVVMGDALRLHQVIANLLTNARVHTPAGSHVEVAVRVADGDAVEVTISDDGPGIAPALQAELFERFARGDSSRSRLAGSTGLGLAIVRAVVEGHRGSVSVESKPGHTVFTLALPTRAEVSIDSQPNIAPPASRAPDPDVRLDAPV